MALEIISQEDADRIARDYNRKRPNMWTVAGICAFILALGGNGISYITGYNNGISEEYRSSRRQFYERLDDAVLQMEHHKMVGKGEDPFRTMFNHGVDKGTETLKTIRDEYK